MRERTGRPPLRDESGQVKENVLRENERFGEESARDIERMGLGDALE